MSAPDSPSPASANRSDEPLSEWNLDDDPPVPLAKPETLLKMLGERMRWRVLRVLADGSQPSVQDLARRTGCHSDLMSRHLKRMRLAGMIREVRSPTGNRRYHHYEVPAEYRHTTPNGRRVIDYGAVVLRF